MDVEPVTRHLPAPNPNNLDSPEYWHTDSMETPPTSALVHPSADAHYVGSSVSLVSETSSASSEHLHTMTATQDVLPLRQSGAKSQSDRSEGQHPKIIRHTLSSWSPEIATMLVSLGSIVSIAALLKHEDRKPLSEWSCMFSLNTIVAILGTLARSTLAFALSACMGQQKWNWLRKKMDSCVAFERFDEASRGPWGAVRLFLWLQIRHWAALGALVIMGTVVLDPFLQAVISSSGQLDEVFLTHNSLDLSGNNATIAVAHGIDRGVLSKANRAAYITNTTGGEIIYMGGFLSRPDFGVVSAIYNGFQDTTSYRNDGGTYTCTTGNCTWPVFASAAFCSSCNDVSGHLVRVTGFGLNGSNNPVSYIQRTEGNYTAFTLPYANISNYDAGHPTRDAVTSMSANLTFDPNLTLSFKHQDTLLVAFAILKAPANWLASSNSWTTADRHVATECGLYLCAKAYKAESKNNVLEEIVEDSWAGRDPSSYKADHSNHYITGPGLDRWIESYGPSLDDDFVPRTDLRIQIPAELPQTFPETMQRSFNISFAFIRSTMDLFLALTRSGDAGAERTRDMMAFPMDNPDDMPPIVDALWYSPNLTATFENVATSLTNQIRNISPDRSAGSLQQWVVHVHVDWAYLAFPVTMIFTGIVYVVLIIVESTRLHVPVWKESALPMLLHGLDDETQSLLRHDHMLSKVNRPKRRIQFDYDEKEDCLRLIPE